MAWSINQLEDRNSYGLINQPIFRTGTAMTWSINQLEDRDSHGLVYQPLEDRNSYDLITKQLEDRVRHGLIYKPIRGQGQAWLGLSTY